MRPRFVVRSHPLSPTAGQLHSQAARRSRRVLTLLAAVFLLLGVGIPAAHAQQGAVAGVVVSGGTDQPLSGVRVAVAGSNRTAFTDATGRFRIEGLTTSPVTLQFTRLGYGGVTRSVALGTTDLRVSLAQSAVSLDALVVTGTAGDARKRTVGNVVSSIDAAQVVETAPVNSVQDLINGRAPGVVITPGTGQVGGGSEIRIRGNSTLSLSGRPLLYVDGVRVDNEGTTGPTVQGFGVSVVSRINDINPADIESIEIIKGPAAATLYGTEASNGVIQIITKKGSAGPPQFNLKVRQGANWFANPDGRIPETYARDDGGNVQRLDIVRREQERGTPIFRTGYLQGYDLNASGGAPNIRYYLGGSFDRNEGAERNNMLRRWSGRANVAITASDKLDLTGTLGYTKSHTNLSDEAGNGGIMWSTLFSSPARLAGDFEAFRGFRTAPPEVQYDAFSSFQEVSRFTGSFQVQHRPTSWFTQRLTVGTDQTNEDNESLTEQSDRFTDFYGVLNGGKFAGRNEVSYNTFDYNGTATFNVREGLTSSTSLGGQFYRRSSHSVTASGDNFPAPGLTVVDATVIQRGGENLLENTTVGGYVQQQFGWRDRLFLTGAVRADDNSAFGSSFNLVYYPKASLSWVLSEEPFWRVPWVSTLKLRSAYGQSGLQPQEFAALRYFLGVAGPGDVAAVTPGAIGNPDLGPERGSEFEIGFDAGFFGGRLGTNFTYYDQHTRDAILLRALPPSAGFSGSQFVNIGEIRNRGIELQVDGQAIQSRKLNWDLALNLARNANEVLDLGDLPSVGGPYNSLETRVGYPVESWFARRIVSAEVNDQGRTVNLMCEGGPENDGQPVPCSGAPRLYQGPSTPKYEGSVTSTFTLFDNLRLNTLFDFKTGYKKFDSNTWIRCSIFRVCIENVMPQEANPVRLAAFQTSRNNAAEYIRDASFTKFREVSLTYTVPDRWASRLGASRASLTVAGRNLHTWSSWPGLDPEARYLTFPAEQNNVPQLAQFVTTVNLSF